MKQFLKQQKLSRSDADELATRVVREFELKSIVVQDSRIGDNEVRSFYDQNRANSTRAAPSPDTTTRSSPSCSAAPRARSSVSAAWRAGS